MKKMSITLDIESGNKKKRQMPRFVELIRAFMRLSSSLPRRDKAELSRLIIIVFTLVAQTYLLIWILTFVLNRP